MRRPAGEAPARYRYFKPARRGGRLDLGVREAVVKAGVSARRDDDHALRLDAGSAQRLDAPVRQLDVGARLPGLAARVVVSEPDLCRPAEDWKRVGEGTSVA